MLLYPLISQKLKKFSLYLVSFVQFFCCMLMIIDKLMLKHWLLKPIAIYCNHYIIMSNFIYTMMCMFITLLILAVKFSVTVCMCLISLVQFSPHFFLSERYSLIHNCFRRTHTTPYCGYESVLFYFL